MNPTPARMGWEWVKGGFAMLRRQPAGLLATFYGYTLIGLLLSVIPLIGPIVFSVTMPVFTIGFLRAARYVLDGKPVRPGTIVEGFREPAVRQLCRLGGVLMASIFVLSLLVIPFMDVEGLRNAAPANVEQAARILMQSVPMWCFAVVQVLSAALLFVTTFAAPLVCWNGMKPGKALFYSFFAIKRTAGAFFVFIAGMGAISAAVLIVVPMLFGGSALGQALGGAASVVLVGVAQTALYLPYVHIFGPPPADPAAPPKA